MSFSPCCHLYPMQTLQIDCLWTFVPMNLEALLRKRMHFVETRRLWVDLKRGGRETKKDSYSSKQVKKSPDSCEVWDQHSFGVVGSGEPHRTRQHFVASAGLACAAARSLPAVCTLARLQNTGSPVRETQWALLSRERQIEKQADIESEFLRASIRVEGKTGEEMEILMEGIKGGLARVDSWNGFEVCCWEVSSHLGWKRD